jgi:hypothetical protein
MSGFSSFFGSSGIGFFDGFSASPGLPLFFEPEISGLKDIE